MTTETKNQSEKPWSPIHESVIVGYFCQAVGYMLHMAQMTEGLDEGTKKRLATAINLSHNPFDPAVGDIIVNLKKTKEFPSEYFIFEIKVDWDKGIKEEHAKLEKKWNLSKATLSEIYAKAIALTTEHKKAEYAHFFGALLKNDSGETLLQTSKYWVALTSKEGERVNSAPVCNMLFAMFRGVLSGKGFTDKELVEYIRALNENAEQGTKASEGSKRLVFAVRNYEMYLLQEDQALDLARSSWEHRAHQKNLGQGVSPTKSEPKRNSGGMGMG